MKYIDIGSVVRRSGLPASTLRYYEERGLITSVGRRGLRRVFAPVVLERLALVGLGRAAGFSLEEIARMLASDGEPRIDRQMLVAKAQELDDTIHRLTAMRNGLRHAAACTARTHMECPTFRRLLRASASGALERRERAGTARAPRTRTAHTRGTARRPANATG
ncbi:MAG: helix-turn-helix domain-containing protein [Deltaproteobacteria bacterium]